MPRNYTHIKSLERQINEMRKEGKSRREIAEHFGLSIKQIVDFITRYNRKQKQLEQGILLNSKGRPRKHPVTSKREMELRIKRLEMENALLRDFLSETGRG